MREKWPSGRFRLIMGALALADALVLIGVILLLLPERPAAKQPTAGETMRETVSEEVLPQKVELEGRGEDTLVIRGAQAASLPAKTEEAAEEEMGEEMGEETGKASPNLQNEYILPDSDKKYLTAEELQGLTDWELALARNEIYARHGRKFKDEKIAEYFSGKSWYTPVYSPEEFDRKGDSVFNTFEIANRKLIQLAEDAR